MLQHRYFLASLQPTWTQPTLAQTAPPTWLLLCIGFAASAAVGLPLTAMLGLQGPVRDPHGVAPPHTPSRPFQDDRLHLQLR